MAKVSSFFFFVLFVSFFVSLVLAYNKEDLEKAAELNPKAIKKIIDEAPKIDPSEECALHGSSPSCNGQPASSEEASATTKTHFIDPSTSGEGLKIPNNSRNPLVDWWRGDPNDPDVLFKWLFPEGIAPECKDKRLWYYRTYDGSCNWLKKDGWFIGKPYNVYQRDTAGGERYKTVSGGYEFQPYDRDTPDRVLKPNPRTLSQDFFVNRTGFHINHTPVLTGMIEYIIHDVSWSENNMSDPIQVPDPSDPSSKGFTFHRNTKTPNGGDGYGNTLPLSVNGATSWIDASPNYGNDPAQNRALRSGIRGKLLTFTGPDGEEYPPRLKDLNPKYRNLPQWKNNPDHWFAGGDPRVNQDWYVMLIQTLWLREHNRIADLLYHQHPDWNDEQIFLSARSIITAKLELVALEYMRGYIVLDEMYEYQWVDDNLQIARLAYGLSPVELNPYLNYASSGRAPNNTQPAVISDEMSVGYRFHDLIPAEVPSYDENDNIIKTVPFINTLFNADVFMDPKKGWGMDNVLRGVYKTTLPGFHAGVNYNLRNANYNLGQHDDHTKFDIVLWSILRERTRGLPTFNQYFRYWNNAGTKKNPHIQVSIRKSFSDFTSNKELAALLASHYETPDDVDLVVGLQLDEELFPGMQIPKSFVIVSLLSLYSVGISDRHNLLYSLFACLKPPNTPLDCRTTVVLDDILWPKVSEPNIRKMSTFWVNEIDYLNLGRLSIWRLFTENTKVKCAPLNPLFVINDSTAGGCKQPYNPVVCSVAEWQKEIKKTCM